MKVSEQGLQQLKRICKEDFNRDLSDEEVLEVAQRLLMIGELLSRPPSASPMG